MECEGLAQRMQTLFGSFNEDDNEKSGIEQLQREYKEKLLHQKHQSEYRPNSLEANRCSSHPWLPWREQDLCIAQSSMGTDIWLNSSSDLRENQLKSIEGTPMACLDVTCSQSPAADRKSSKLMSVLADSDCSMHHQEVYYAHHRHHLHHSHAGGPVNMHGAHTEHVNLEPSRFEALLSLDDENASGASHGSHCEAHHSYDYPHHHQHYHMHHHRHGHHLTHYPRLSFFRNSLVQENSADCDAAYGNNAELPQFSGNMTSGVDYDADNDKPLTLEDLKEWHRQKMTIENNLHNTCNLQVRIIQWLNDVQSDPTLCTAKDDSVTTEHAL